MADQEDHHGLFFWALWAPATAMGFIFLEGVAIVVMEPLDFYFSVVILNRLLYMVWAHWVARSPIRKLRANLAAETGAREAREAETAKLKKDARLANQTTAAVASEHATVLAAERSERAKEKEELEEKLRTAEAAVDEFEKERAHVEENKRLEMNAAAAQAAAATAAAADEADAIAREAVQLEAEKSESPEYRRVSDNALCYRAAMNGRLDMLQWARETKSPRCPWDESTCWVAAQKGHLEILKWAKHNGCLWNEETCNKAARNGHLDVLQWAIDHGCPWNMDECLSAATRQPAVAEWLHTQ